MFISDGLAYLPAIFPTDEEMDSYTKANLTPDVEWMPHDIYDYVQWDESDNDASFGANISATIYNRSYDVLKSILSSP